MSIGKPDDKQRKRSALLLSALLTTPDERLEAFRKRRIGPDSTIDVESLRHARELLEAVGAAIEINDTEQWERIYGACRLLRESGGGAQVPIQDERPADVPAVDAPPPPPLGVGLDAGAADGGAIPQPAISDPGAKSSPWVSPTSSAGRSAPGEPNLAARSDPSSGPSPANMTLPVDDVVRKKPRTLPFKMPPHNAPADTASASPLAPKAGGEPDTSSEPRLASGSSAPDPDPSRPPAGATLPIDEAAAQSRATAGEPPNLDVDQYARLCAECAVFPERAQQANRQFGVADAHIRQRLDQQWLKRFAQQPEVRAQWKELLAHYKQWLRQGA